MFYRRKDKRNATLCIMKWLQVLRRLQCNLSPRGIMMWVGECAGGWVWVGVCAWGGWCYMYASDALRCSRRGATTLLQLSVQSNGSVCPAAPGAVSQRPSKEGCYEYNVR